MSGLILLAKVPIPTLVFALGWGLARLKKLRPKRHTRPLPFRRHR